MASADANSLPAHPMSRETVKEHLKMFPSLKDKVNAWLRAGYWETKHLLDEEDTVLIIKGNYQEYNSPQIVVTIRSRSYRDTYHFICPTEIGCDPHYDGLRERYKGRAEQYMKECDEERAREAKEVEDRIQARKEREKQLEKERESQEKEK